MPLFLIYFHVIFGLVVDGEQDQTGEPSINVTTGTVTAEDPFTALPDDDDDSDSEAEAREEALRSFRGITSDVDDAVNVFVRA